MLQFFQTGDWHLGQSYGRFDPDFADRLRAARLDAVSRALAEAEASGAAFVVVAGDQFEGAQPGVPLVRAMLERIRATALPVHMIPGNHDPCGPGSAYEYEAFRKRPANLHFHDRARPVPLPEFGATLFPCPCFDQFGPDSLGWIPPRGPDDGLRIALAHGSLPVAPGTAERNYPIAADAAGRFDLDYVALGDWHTPTPDPAERPGERMYYAGAPEVGGWDETRAGHALRVELSPGAAPRVSAVRVGQYVWSERTPPLYSAEDVDRLARELDEAASLARVVRLRPTGALSLIARESLRIAVEARRSSFASLELDLSGLRLLDDADFSPPSDPVLREVHRRLLKLLRDPSDGLPETFPGVLPAPDAADVERAVNLFRGLLP